MKKTLALLLALIAIFSICTAAFADDAAAPSENSEFAVLNQGVNFYAAPDSTEAAGFLGQNQFVKVVEVVDGKANIQWENTCRFNGKINGDAWVDAEALAMITEEDLPKYLLPYPDLDKWLGREKVEGGNSLWILYTDYMHTAEYWNDYEIGDDSITQSYGEGFYITLIDSRHTYSPSMYKYIGSGKPETDAMGMPWGYTNSPS